MRREDRVLKAEYKLVENDDVMVVLTDVTDEIRQEDKVRSERQRLEMVAAVTESRDFFDTVKDFRSFTLFDLPAILQSVVDAQVIVKTIYREIHTFKGLLNQFALFRPGHALNFLRNIFEVGRTQVPGTEQPGLFIGPSIKVAFVSRDHGIASNLNRALARTC